MLKICLHYYIFPLVIFCYISIEAIAEPYNGKDSLQKTDRNYIYDGAVKRNGLFYEAFSNIPYSGSITGATKPDGSSRYYESGSITEGKKYGQWKTYKCTYSCPSSLNTSDYDTYLILELNYVDGVLNGPASEYVKNGSRSALIRQYNYKGGDVNGSWKAYSGNNLIEEGYIENNKRNREWRFYDGTGAVIGSYIDGKKNGIFETYRNLNTRSCFDCTLRNSPSKRNSFINGEEEGFQEVFYDNGTLKEVKEYRDGALVSFENYNRYGETISSLTYLNGKKSGSELTFYTDGQLKSSENWITGEKHGQWDFYDEYGNIVKTEIYDSGRIVENFSYINGIAKSKTVYVSNFEKILYELDENENPINSKKYINNLLIEEKSFFTDPESGETFITEGRTINNKREGTWKFFNNEGYLHSKGEYESGIQSGQWEFYFNPQDESDSFDSETPWDKIVTFFSGEYEDTIIEDPDENFSQDSDEYSDYDNLDSVEENSSYDSGTLSSQEEMVRSDVISDYGVISKVAPIYPRRALTRGIEGYCIVEFSITSQGTTANLKAIDCSSELFARSSINAVSKFKFKPRTVNGIPVTVPVVRNKISFSLGN